MYVHVLEILSYVFLWLTFVTFIIMFYILTKDFTLNG